MFKKFNDKARFRLDIAIAFAIVLFLTWHPYYLHQKINLFELGLYLPGIDAILRGEVPYRDFFYLRGPMDLYLSAMLMKIFGTDAAVLATYFYVGTVITLLAAVLIAREIIPSRILFFTFVPVLVMRTFPRVVFTFWGGMRYAWGLLAVWCVIRFIKSPKRGWILAAGFLTVLAALTSVEIGVCLAVAVTVTLIIANRQGLIAYWLILFACLLPFNYYFAMTGAWVEFMNTHLVIARELTNTFPQTEPVPSNLGEILHALLVPTDKNFRQMTPLFSYILFLGYFIWRWRKKTLDLLDKVALLVAVYGFMVYVTGFRNLWANVFEMSLQPQKIVFFYLLARLVQYCMPWKKKIAYVILAAIIISSLAFSIQRMNKRFLFFRKDPLKGQEVTRMDLPRIKGFVVPKEQAQDIIALNAFTAAHVEPKEAMLMYPEMGAMHFIVNRPWVDRFAMGTLTWFSPIWFDTWQKALETKPPRYGFVLKQMPDYFYTGHLKVERNRAYFKTTMDFIANNYDRVGETPSYWILKHKGAL